MAKTKNKENKRVEIIWQDPVSKKRVKSMDINVNNQDLEDDIVDMFVHNVQVIKRNRKSKYKEPVFNTEKIINELPKRTQKIVLMNLGKKNLDEVLEE